MATTSDAANSNVQGALSGLGDSAQNLSDTGANIVGDLLGGLVERPVEDVASDTGGYGYATGGEEGYSYTVPQASAVPQAPPAPPQRNPQQDIKPSEPKKTESKKHDQQEKNKGMTTIFEASGSV